MREVTAAHGEWTDHNMLLADGVYTISPEVVSHKLRRIVQVVSDVSLRPISELRVLDLACLEGGYALEFARQGATVVAIEGREANISKARFAKEQLGLENIEFSLDDVRNLSRERYGEFDVVLCLGILYHLDTEDVVNFVHSIGEVCSGFAVFDTFVGMSENRRFSVKGREYWGRLMHEHAAEATEEERLHDLWASIDNPKSFWISRPSLLNLLQHAGFSSVHETFVPVELEKPADRLTLVAFKGAAVELQSQPSANALPQRDIPEGFKPRVSRHQRLSTAISKKVNAVVPASFRRGVKTALRKVGVLPEAKEPWDWSNPWEKRGPR
jgi:2-polyprenyl-3-methyl-5-hydroxy-6-metoxy-1,4-benzoquinol methylase